ncbi:hypothetical protein [Parasphingorhabdus halotolerans]|uniref:Uncharacterized protein n=1 Tax=Parasphingorhabdus halotolerans TaxID=2725558 RepID=A0A6H2DI28_9SPHN|nr:hypothetical protein [Parasphingorhabdus halotolerans]QJB68040.1 hypothetical protein HF685_00885 [Parasphingorhabdus halotolerans]
MLAGLGLKITMYLNKIYQLRDNNNIVHQRKEANKAIMFSSNHISFQYADAFAILAEKHDISINKEVAFRGRLQHFQRLNFPSGVNTGKGNPAKYGWRELFLLALALEYLEIGSTPERSVQEISKFEDNLTIGIAKVVSSHNAEKEAYFLITELSGLLVLRKEHCWADRVKLVTQSEIGMIFSEQGDDRFNSPYAIIDLRQLIGSLLLAVFKMSSFSKDNIVRDLKAWSHDVGVEVAAAVCEGL